MSKKYRLNVDCKVKWADHFVEHGDYDLKTVQETVKEPAYGTYRGVIVAESKQMIALCPNIWDDDDEMESLSDPMYIMKTAIVEIKYLEERPGDDK